MIIDKILDKYYFKKLKNMVCKIIRNAYDIDYKFEKSNSINSYVHLKIKDKKYNDKSYKICYTFNTTNALEDLLNYKEIVYEILEIIYNYFKELE